MSWTDHSDAAALLAQIAADRPARVHHRSSWGHDIPHHEGTPARQLRQLWRRLREQAFDPKAHNGGDEWAAIISLRPEDAIEQAIAESLARKEAA